MFWLLLILANGTALVMFNGTAAGPLNLTLPTPAATPPVVELNGTPVPALYGGTWVAVPAPQGAVVTVRYVPQILQRGPLLYINLTTPDTVLVLAEGGVLLAPQRVINYTMQGGALLVLLAGPQLLGYTVPTAPPTAAVSSASPATPQPTAAPTSQQAPPPTQRPPTTAPPPPTPGPPPAAQWTWPQWAWPALAAAAAAAVALLLRRRRQQAEGLSEVDTAVLNYVRSRGGAYEAEVARALNIPRTTVYRAVRRLAEAGYVRVDKRDGRNWIEPAR